MKKQGTDKTDIITGINSVTESLKAGRRVFSEILISREKGKKRTLEIEKMAAQGKIPIRNVTTGELEKIVASKTHQGIAARVSSYPYAEVEDILIKAEQAGTPPFILLIDSVEDPHNLGALVRTALCSGVHGIIIPKDRAASPDSVASKISAGATEHMLIARVTNLVTTIKDLKSSGIWIAGLDAGAADPIYSLDASLPTGLVVGGEDKGVRRLVSENCDFLVSLPQVSSFNSLNASVAGAVAMYEVVRQRTSLG